MVQMTKFGWWVKILVIITLISLGSAVLAACGENTTNTATPGVTVVTKTSLLPPTNTPAADNVTPTIKPESNLPPTATPLPKPTANPLPFMPTPVPLITELMTDTRPFNLNWKITLDEPSTVRVIDETSDLVFVKSRLGALYALKKSDGAIVWKHAAQPQSGPTSPTEVFATVTKDVTIIGDVAAETLIAYDTRTGQSKWTHGLRFDAPSRDAGSRWLGGRVYSNTLVVAVSSKQDPFNPQRQTKNPEFVLVAGIELATGQAVWSYITTPADLNIGSRLANVLFSSKIILIEEPGFSVIAFDGASGVKKWFAPQMFILRSENLDTLYSGEPGGGQPHTPNFRRHDIETGKVLWERTVPLKIVNDPLIAISPDERVAYFSAKVSDKESALVAYNIDTKNLVWNVKTTDFGEYELSADNEGVRLRNFGQNAGLIYFPKENPLPAKWQVGGLEFGEETQVREGLYITGRQLIANNQYLNAFYLLDLTSGATKLATTVSEIPSAEAYVGEKTVYLPGYLSSSKNVIYSYQRP